MFDNIQSVNDAKSGNSDLNVSLYQDSYGDSNKIDSSPGGNQLASWKTEVPGSKLSNDSQLLTFPSLDLTSLPNQKYEKSQSFDNDLAQAPNEADRRSARILEEVTRFGSDNKLPMSSLDAVGVTNVNQSWQRVFDSCPKNGDEKQTESGGQSTGLTTVGPDGHRIPVKTGQTIDRYYKSEDGFYSHARTVNTMGALGELERVMETANHTKIYLYNQIPANGEVRVDVLLPNGKSGVQINAQTSQLKELLKLIKQADKEQTAISPF